MPATMHGLVSRVTCWIVAMMLSVGWATAHAAAPHPMDPLEDTEIAPPTSPTDSVEADSQAAASPAIGTVARWRWLKDTFWYVPTSNLLAFLFVAEQERLLPISDQTVFHITDFRDGYFWGRTVAHLQLGPNESQLTCLSLVGSITPEGQVLLTFTPTDLSGQPTVTQGIGQMRFRLGQWRMEPQMSTGPVQSQVIHWAYMTQSRPDEPSWESLPGVGVSIPDFLSHCPGGPHLVGP